MDLMRSDCSSHFIRMMDDMDIHHDWIQFEITETVATEYNAGLGMVVDGFMAAGVRLCLDDFGSGYANLNTVTGLITARLQTRSIIPPICLKNFLSIKSLPLVYPQTQYNTGYPIFQLTHF